MSESLVFEMWSEEELAPEGVEDMTSTDDVVPDDVEPEASEA